VDGDLLIRKLNAKTAEEMAPYLGKIVAWSEDGTQALASASDLDLLYKEINRLGLKHYVIEHVPSADESFLGGGSSI
jgi:hypothetical protein